MHLAGVACAVGAAVLLLLALTALDWLSSGGLSTGSGSDASFRGMRDILSLGDLSGQVEPRVVASAYFTWGAWVLLVIGVGAGILGNVAAAAGHWGRGPGLVALVVGLLGVAATAVAIDLFAGKGGTSVPAYSDYLTHVGPAFFCAVAGYLLIAFSGAAAARRPLPSAQPDPDEPDRDEPAQDGRAAS